MFNHVSHAAWQGYGPVSLQCRIVIFARHENHHPAGPRTYSWVTSRANGRFRQPDNPLFVPLAEQPYGVK